MVELRVGGKYAFQHNENLKLSNSPRYAYGVEYDDFEDLNKLGIRTIYDLLTFRPEEYNSPLQYLHLRSFNEKIAFYDLEDLFDNGAFNSVIKNLLIGLPDIKDFLPKSVLQDKDLMPLNIAIRQLHYPDSEKELSSAIHRLAFNEVFLIQCGLKLIKRESISQGQGITCKGNGVLVPKVIDRLPFNLTDDQLKTFKTISEDMENPKPMRRLVQGDVGSGKTVVAMLALVKAVENGYQGAMLAPTEILAVQHYNNFVDFLGKFGIKVGLLSAKVTRSKKAKQDMYQKIANHKFDIVVGTHALIKDEVKFAKLGLAITDEQHRFGVAQRAKLANKSDINPDVLAMTATPIPIPRTLSLTLYGDLDVSIIKQMPAGRKPIKTMVKTSRGRRSAYEFVRKEILEGRQAYVVCPLRASFGRGNLRTHGKMKAVEKDNVMTRFKNGEIRGCIHKEKKLNCGYEKRYLKQKSISD